MSLPLQRFGTGAGLLLLRAAQLRPGVRLHRPGHRPALPPVHLERVLPEAPLRGHAPARHSRPLPVLHRCGPGRHQGRRWENSTLLKPPVHFMDMISKSRCKCKIILKRRGEFYNVSE